MGTSVKISLPMLTADEVAKIYGISAKRQRELTKIVQEAAASLRHKKPRRTITSKMAVSRSKAV
jgi:hypothetical protein